MHKNERIMLSTDLLRTMVAIAESGNLTVAAGRLHRTQSAISVQLRKLETDLNVTLFDRTPRGMALTEAGKTLLPRAYSILEEIKQASMLFAAELTGYISVGIPDDLNDAVLQGILMEFAAAHPGVEVEAISGCTSGYPAALLKGDLDIAVCSGLRIEGGEPLEAEKTVWAAARGVLSAEPAVIPLAILDRVCWWRDLPAEALRACGRPYKIAFQSSNFGSLRSAIRAGFAVGVLPLSCVDDDMIILSRADGFPPLPNSQRAILRSPQARDDLAAAMTEAIKTALEDQRRV